MSLKGTFARQKWLNKNQQIMTKRDLKSHFFSLSPSESLLFVVWDERQKLLHNKIPGERQVFPCSFGKL